MRSIVVSNVVRKTIRILLSLWCLLFQNPGVSSFHPSSRSTRKKHESPPCCFAEPLQPQPQAANARYEAEVNPATLLYAEHEKLLVNRGEFEAGLMPPGVPLAAVKGGGGGFGGSNSGHSRGGSGKSSKKILFQAQARDHALVLKEQGLVRIDNILTPAMADSIREKVYNLRFEAEQDLASGKLASAQDVFANVLLNHNRRDMTLPLGPTWIAQTLSKIILESPIGPTMDLALGPHALLREWSCLMSDPGSQRQVVHPDTPWNPEPVLYTCFVALQDISMDMGPTIWLPKTHTQAMHELFKDEHGSDNQKDKLLANTPNVIGPLPKGACVIFDSRLLHCGSANQSQQSRALLYCSFQNPNIANPGNPGSIRSNLLGRWTLQDLIQELQAFQKGKPSKLVDR
jgi:ectoine hydroxylase-related dioxygenase (phytanoyl-CoA dioxygenase family)